MIGLFLLTFQTWNAATEMTEQCNWQRFSFGKLAWFKEAESLLGSCVPKRAMSHKHHFTRAQTSVLHNPRVTGLFANFFPGRMQHRRKAFTLL